MRRLRETLLILLLAVGALVPAATASAAELLMFERAGCPWCARWLREVAPAYEKSEEGAYAPLRRIDMDRGDPADVTLTIPVRFSPTFVLVDRGREVGRLIGYIDAATFWGLLTKMVQDHRARSDSPPVQPAAGGRSG